MKNSAWPGGRPGGLPGACQAAGQAGSSAEDYIDSLVSHLEMDPLLFNKKILIDLSNETGKKSDMNESSNAEQLQIAIPDAFVVNS